MIGLSLSCLCVVVAFVLCSCCVSCCACDAFASCVLWFRCVRVVLVVYVL